ncbi:hypothetical protein N431DRAFT_500611 [Stipitochalara longipes BDJ]|nr:hypothetical protein N431DRAFT_500611 [Stipitochalara longipes BDJ]
MSRTNKRRGGIGFNAEDEPEPPTIRPGLDPCSDEFLEGQILYAKIRSEIQRQFLGEAENAFRKTITKKMKDEIRRGMVLDVQEEGRKLLASQKKKLLGELRKEVRREIEKEMGLEPDREEKMRERVRREVREEMREEWERRVEDARREVRYEMEESVAELEEKVAALEEASG